MSPRRSLAEARETRAAIVERAVHVSSLEGLEGLTIGRLAADLQMSKSGVLGHFGTKEALQLTALEAAIDVFRREVWEPAAGAESGLPRLLAICEAWISYLERDVFPGGCFLTAASCEFDGRAGPVRDAVVEVLSRWDEALQSQVRRAIDAGDLPPSADPATIAFQLNAIAMGANQALQLLGDRSAPERARRAMRATLLVDPASERV
jgi:AcrR family transcriptional regulator